MLIIYDSLTGNVERFIKKLKLIKHINTKKISDDLVVNEPYILVTYTVGFGQVPESTTRFLNENYQLLKAVVSSGNKNWGKLYANAGEVVSNSFNVPLILKFELSGTSDDVEKFLQEVNRIDKFNT